MSSPRPSPLRAAANARVRSSSLRVRLALRYNRLEVDTSLEPVTPEEAFPDVVNAALAHQEALAPQRVRSIIHSLDISPSPDSPLAISNLPEAPPLSTSTTPNSANLDASLAQFGCQVRFGGGITTAFSYDATEIMALNAMVARL